MYLIRWMRRIGFWVFGGGPSPKNVTESHPDVPIPHNIVYYMGTGSTGLPGGAWCSGAHHARARRSTRLQKGVIADRNWLNRAGGSCTHRNRRGDSRKNSFRVPNAPEFDRDHGGPACSPKALPRGESVRRGGRLCRLNIGWPISSR